MKQMVMARKFLFIFHQFSIIINTNIFQNNHVVYRYIWTIILIYSYQEINKEIRKSFDKFLV